MWVGELEIRQENVEGFRQGLKIGIKLESQQASVRGEKNFDWDSDVKVAKFSKFPRSCLKKKNDMKCFIKQSHILRVLPKAMEEYQTNHAMLLRLLSGKSCGYLEAVPDSDQVYRPLILMVTKDNQENEMLVGFCVDNPIKQEHVRDKKETITTFNKLFKENIKYSMVSTVVDQIWPGKDPGKEKALNNKNGQNIHAINENGDVPSNGMTNIVELARSVINTKTSEAAKDIQKDFLTAFNGSLSNLKADIPFENSDPETMKCDMILKYKSHTDWNINFYDKNINYLAIFVKNGSMDDEHVIFCKDSVNLLSYLTDIYDSEFKVSSITNQKGKISHPQIEKDIGIRVVENLSSFEQHFLKLGAFEEDLIIVEMEMLKKLCEQFEIKHEAEVMVIPKLESSPPFIFCSITSNETLARIETCDSKIEEGSPRVSFKRKHHNPDEIIEGRPKWSKIKMLRKSMVQTQHEQGTSIEEKVEEEILDFNRLNPHRSNIPEFDDKVDERLKGNLSAELRMSVLNNMRKRGTEIGEKKVDCLVEGCEEKSKTFRVISKHFRNIHSSKEVLGIRCDIPSCEWLCMRNLKCFTEHMKIHNVIADMDTKMTLVIVRKTRHTDHTAICKTMKAKTIAANKVKKEEERVARKEAKIAKKTNKDVTRSTTGKSQPRQFSHDFVTVGKSLVTSMKSKNQKKDSKKSRSISEDSKL